MKKLFSTWKEEILGIPGAIILFFLSPYLLHWIDPTAGTYDAGIFQIILFATIQLLMFNGLTWFGIKIVFPKVWDYFQNYFDNEFIILEPWQKAIIGLFIWGLFLLSFVALSRVL